MAKNNATVDRIQTVWNMIGGDEVIDELLAGNLKLRIETAPVLTTLTSRTVESVTVKFLDFFEAREGLSVSGIFKDRVLKGATMNIAGGGVSVVSYADVLRKATDLELVEQLPEGYLFEDVNAFLVQLATLIYHQWGGRTGTLLNNGSVNANVFYVKVNDETIAVDICSETIPGRWRLNARYFNYGPNSWVLAGRRVFSAAAA